MKKKDNKRIIMVGIFILVYVLSVYYFAEHSNSLFDKPGVSKVEKDSGGGGKATTKATATAKATTKPTSTTKATTKPKSTSSSGGSSNPPASGCSSGQWRGQYGCETCPAGYYCNGTSKNACPANSTSSSGSSSCTCNSGYHSDNGQCVYTTPPASGCSSGQWRGQYGCETCPAGYYCNGTSKTACPANSSSPAGSSSVSSCTCNSGFSKYIDGSCRANSGCSSGQWRGEHNCETCPAGYYCNGISKTACPAEMTSPAGSSSDSACVCKDSQYEREGTKCKLIKIGTCSASVSANGTRFSVGDTVSVTVTISGHCTAGVSVSGNVPGCSGSFTKATTLSCSTTATECKSYSVSVSGAASSSWSSDIVRRNWNKTSDNTFDTKPPKDEAEANSQGKDVYATNCRNVGGKYECTDVHNRNTTSCGGATDPPRTPTPPPSSTPSSTPIIKYSFCCVDSDGTKKGYYENQSALACPDSSQTPYSSIPKSDCNNRACYANAPTLAKATDAGIQNDKSLARPYKIEGIDTADACIILEDKPDLCNPKTEEYYYNDDINVEKCEKAIAFNVKDGATCEGNSFYDISCTTASTVSFDNGDDSDVTTDVNHLYAGQGFGYGIYVTTQKKCTASFNASAWNEAYQRTERIISNAQRQRSITGLSERDKNDYLSLEMSMRNLQNDLKSIVSTYNNYNYLPEFGGETATVELKYDANVNGKTTEKTINKSFQSVLVSDGVAKIYNRSTVNLGVSGVKNPENYTWSIWDNPHVIKLIPSHTYLDEYTGEETTSGGIDGGNKIYLGYDAVPMSERPYTIVLNGIYKLSSDSSIINNKCKITVSDYELKYRSVDVSNPFINAKWEKGKNWVNEKYDFTQAIHATTWSESKKMDITLKNSEIDEIRSSNKSNSDSYLGICGKLKKLYGVDAKICDAVSKLKGK